MLLEKVTLEDKIGQLFIVDIKFDYENRDAKQIMYNEIYPSVVDKQKQLDANERSIFQLCDRKRQTGWDRQRDRQRAEIVQSN